MNYDEYKLDNPDDYQKRMFGIPLHIRKLPDEKESFRTRAWEHQRKIYFNHKK